MVKAVIEGVRIAGLRTAVPTRRHSFVEDPRPFTAQEAEKLYASTGVHGRRVAPPHMCASDMCLAAAEGLLAQLGWEPASVEVLVFVTQGPDYVLPATACLMQRRLGLPTTCAAFDVTLGCSGFVYGLWIASRLLGRDSARRALVLCGDTSSHHLIPDDRSTLPLFGDAGAAAALEVAGDAPPIHAVFGTDGTGAPHITMKAGGRRDPLIPPLFPHSPEEQERLFRDARLHLNGAEVFAFTLRAVPPLVRAILDHAGLGIEDVDQVVLHQANRFMLDHLRKKTGIPQDKFLVDLRDFGNTSSASIPLAVCHRLGPPLAASAMKLLFAGFGVGWSWGAMIADVGPIPEPTVVDIPDDFPCLTP